MCWLCGWVTLFLAPATACYLLQLSGHSSSVARLGAVIRRDAGIADAKEVGAERLRTDPVSFFEYWKLDTSDTRERRIKKNIPRFLYGWGAGLGWQV